MSIKTAIGLRQGARITDLGIKTSAAGFPYLNMTVVAKKTTHPKAEEKEFYHKLPTWADMDEAAKGRLKENCLQLLKAFEVNNAETIINKRYPGGPEEFFQAVIDALPKSYKRTLVDIFLEFEYKIGTNKDGSLKDRTWPTIATGASGKSGDREWRSYWITPAQDGVFKPNVTEQDGKKMLTFVNEQGDRHPISRTNSWFNGRSDEPQGNIQEFKAESQTDAQPSSQSSKELAF